jgi:hypothetical protein
MYWLNKISLVKLFGSMKMMGKSRLLRALVLSSVLATLPVGILVKNYSTDSGFLKLIHFGQELKTSQLSQINTMSLPPLSPLGYDGQFYAQIALRPTLTGNDLVGALDAPTWRSRRIGLPLLAFLLGHGNPNWILQIYALLNFAFWILFLLVLGFSVGYQRLRDVLLAFALLWSSGTLISISRSLTDFPAVVMGFVAVISCSTGNIAACLFGAAALIKETSILSFATILWLGKQQGNGVRRVFVYTLIMCLPIALWLLYVHFKMPLGAVLDGKNITFPLLGFIHKLSSATNAVAVVGFPASSISLKAYYWFEVFCPLSLAAQSVYLIAKPRIASDIWRFGIGFVLLGFFLGDAVWVEVFAYSRVLLPLTFSFNLLLHKYESGKRFVVWHIIGNSGMCWSALNFLL